MKELDAVGLGALNMDTIYQVECILDDGETVVKESSFFPGGSAANTIYGLAKLGLNTGFIGAVGDDAEGKVLIKDFQNAGVDTGQIKVIAREKTGSTLCLSDQLGKRSIYVLSGVNSHLSLDSTDLYYINSVKVLHVSSFVDNAQLKALLELMPSLDKNVKLSFSPGAIYASMGLEILKPILARTDILFVNRTELRQLTDDEVTSGAEVCLKHGCKTVVVTMGKGAVYQRIEAVCYIMSVENEYIIESFEDNTLSTADTIGAGDAFAAGFLFGYLNGKGLEECGYLGNIVARFSIARTGARQGLPTSSELTHRYRQLYNKQL